MFLSQGPIAVIDVETTGLFPSRNDRIVELAVLILKPDGQIEREFVSLVNPARDIGPISIHGLTSADILHAPQFGDIAAQLVDVLTGCVAIAGHNVKFELSFLESEFSRINHWLPKCFSICTMQIAGGGRLAECCGDYGISFPGEAHHAYADANATARLLTCLLPEHRPTLQQLSTLTPIQWPVIARINKHPISRDESRRRQSEMPTFLQRLLGRMQSGNSGMATDGAVMAYCALLVRVLEDRQVNDAEADALLETAIAWGLNGDQVRQAHGDFLNQLATAAIADGIVTDVERRDLKLVARLLGHENPNLDAILNEAAERVANAPLEHSVPENSNPSLIGKRVCFTGEMQCSHNGRLISRENSEDLASKAGLEVVYSVSKKLDLLVLADPDSQSGKAKKARQYGIRIMHEPVFWKTLGVKVS